MSDVTWGKPNPGSLWVHTSGTVYQVRFCTNRDGSRQPIDVVYYTRGYENDPEHQYSRPLSDWYRSFTPLSSEV